MNLPLATPDRTLGARSISVLSILSLIVLMNYLMLQSSLMPNYSCFSASNPGDEATQESPIYSNQNEKDFHQRCALVPAKYERHGTHPERILIPSHYMCMWNNVARNDCALPSDAFCRRFSAGDADPHVEQVIMTVLPGRCSKATKDSTLPPIVWDFGANVGQFTLFMRAIGCRVISVEPQPSMNVFHHDSLAANRWNSDESVVLYEKGVSNQTGIIKLDKLWQPGNKSAGSMTVETVTVDKISQQYGRAPVELLKIDIDGPELFSLSGVANLFRTQTVKNIIAELTVSSWARMGFSDELVLELFDKFYSVGAYRMLLVHETEFSKYPQEILNQTKEVRNLGQLTLAYDIPREMIGQVLFMANRLTKNIFMTRDPEIIQLLDSKL
mmetsp:Transcript_40285/g.97297  ORF Transcript_40285/g.97297 Transcript_40285/m.97297 type:complete len:385 (-) Transcript_40285:315-1469(-)